MKMETEQNITPDRWVVVEFTTDEGVFCKILSGWQGGYLNSETWRLSSVVVNESEMKHFYEFTTQSGSTYKCLHTHEGLTGVTRDVLEKIRKQFPDARVKLLCYGDQT